MHPLSIARQAKFAARIEAERKANAAAPELGFSVTPGGAWRFALDIKAGAYAGQSHTIEMKLAYGRGDDVYFYPIHAPMCVFISKIWHPNISEAGTICLDVLRDNWSPVMRTSAALDAIRLLLDEPNPDSPQNKKAAATMAEGAAAHAAAIASFYLPTI